MTRETSKKTYLQIKREGLLSELRFKVFNSLYQNGPQTTSQLARRTKQPRVSVSPRMIELVRLGVVREFGSAPCPVTGRDAIIWGAVNRLPKKLKKKNKLTIARRIYILKNAMDCIVNSKSHFAAKEYASMALENING